MAQSRSTSKKIVKKTTSKKRKSPLKKSSRLERPLELLGESKETVFKNKYEILGAILVIALISLTYAKWPK